MKNLFLEILPMSFNAGVVALVVIGARLLLKKAPRIFSYTLWAVVLFRLFCPVSFESGFGFLPAGQSTALHNIASAAAGAKDNPLINASLSYDGELLIIGYPSVTIEMEPSADGSGFGAEENNLSEDENGLSAEGNNLSEDASGLSAEENHLLTDKGSSLTAEANPHSADSNPEAAINNLADSVNATGTLAENPTGLTLFPGDPMIPFHFWGGRISLHSLITAAAALWLGGAVLLFAFSLFGYFRLKYQLKTATLVRGNIYETDRITTPFVLGFIRPRIYLPAGMEDVNYILKHEYTHIRRFDYLIKPLAFLALCLHWFNPVIWLSYFLMCRDMEMSCDESVLRNSAADIRKSYSDSLLKLSARQSGLLSPLAFGESSTGKRVKNVLNYQKPTRFASAIALLVLLAVTVGCAANSADTAPGTSATASINTDGFILENHVYSSDDPPTENPGVAGTDTNPAQNQTADGNHEDAADYLVSEEITVTSTASSQTDSGIAHKYEAADNSSEGYIVQQEIPEDAAIHFPFPSEKIAQVNIALPQTDFEITHKYEPSGNRQEGYIAQQESTYLSLEKEITVTQEGLPDAMTAYLTVRDLGYVIYLPSDWSITSTDDGDLVVPAESSPVFKTFRMKISRSDGRSPLPEDTMVSEFGEIGTSYLRFSNSSLDYMLDVSLSCPWPEGEEGGKKVLESICGTLAAPDGSPFIREIKRE